MATVKRLIDANALEFEPDENCIANGVLIWGGRTGGKAMATVLSALKKMIDNAPTVDAVEVVHGRWNQDGVYDVCSVCNRCTLMPHLKGLPRFNYCPNCGAKNGDGNA